MTIPLTLRQEKGSPLEWSEVDGNFTALRTGIESVDLSGLTPRTSPTGAAVLPAGTTAQRDDPALPGYVRFNETLNQFEGFNGTDWGPFGGGVSDPLAVNTLRANTITDRAGTGAPNFTNGLRLNTNAVLGPVTGDAPMFACRAWVNFNGTGTVAIRASGNVSSITDNGVGDYTVNFTAAMPDENYCVSLSSGGFALENVYRTTIETGQFFQAGFRFRTGGAGVFLDHPACCVAVFR